MWPGEGVSEERVKAGKGSFLTLTLKRNKELELSPTGGHSFKSSFFTRESF